MTLIKPLIETTDTVTLSRADWDLMLAELEDLNVRAAVMDAAREREREASGEVVPERDYLTGWETHRIVVDGIHPIVVWRDKRELTQAALAAAVGISASHLSEIEHRQKGPSVDVLQRLAAVLQVTVDDLLPSASD
jgi:DNA-binding XRE family transcriptional regulator